MPVYHVLLGALRIELMSEDTAVIAHWAPIFEEECIGDGIVADVTLTLSLVETLPPWPGRFDIEEPISGLGVVHHGDGNALFFAAGAYAFSRHRSPVIEGQIMQTCLSYIEDVTYTFLAAACRQRGHYLLHAFAAERDGEAVLFVAPSGGGKTTTGLALLRNGFRLLANDTAVLTSHNNTIKACPTPEQIRVRRPTFALLHWLREVEGPLTTTSFLQRLGFERGVAARVGALYFLDLEPERPCCLTLLPKPVALARLLEASIDRWDRTALAAHAAFLQALCEQAHTYRLRVGTDVGPNLARILEHGDITGD